MESVPPPHERSWRHPSELAPPPPEAPTRSFRIAAAVSGAASVALVGLFALAITPGDGPITVSSSTVTPSAFGTSPVSMTASTSATPSATTLPGERSVVLISSNKAVTSGERTVGESHTTVWISERITAQALLMAEVGGVAVVDLDDREGRDLGLTQYLVATSVPRKRDQVTVLIDGTPHVVTLDEVPDLDADPGTAIFDRQGRLIALCDEGGDPIVIVPPPSTPTTTTLPPTTVPPTTVLPPTTDVATTTTTEPTTTTSTVPPRTTTTTEPPTTTTRPPTTTTTAPPTTTTDPPTTTTDPPTTTTRPATTTTSVPATTTTAEPDGPTNGGED